MPEDKAERLRNNKRLDQLVAYLRDDLLILVMRIIEKQQDLRG